MCRGRQVLETGLPIPRGGHPLLQAFLDPRVKQGAVIRRLCNRDVVRVDWNGRRVQTGIAACFIDDAAGEGAVAHVGEAVPLEQPGERVGDLFCGLGNFSLPIARQGAEVMGFEGSAELVERARANASANGLVAQFQVTDLFKHGIAAFGPFDKLLLDPPREGAVELIKSLPEGWPRRIVYVSCDPATLARDAGVLVHSQGFRLVAAGVANMFPHTAHVESITLFERGEMP